jgi:hypothetical protein
LVSSKNEMNIIWSCCASERVNYVLIWNPSIDSNMRLCLIDCLFCFVLFCFVLFCLFVCLFVFVFFVSVHSLLQSEWGKGITLGINTGSSFKIGFELLFRTTYTGIDYRERCAPIDYARYSSLPPSLRPYLTKAGRFLLLPVNPACVRGFSISLYVGAQLGSPIDLNVYTALNRVKDLTIVQWKSSSPLGQQILENIQRLLAEPDDDDHDDSLQTSDRDDDGSTPLLEPSTEKEFRKGMFAKSVREASFSGILTSVMCSPFFNVFRKPSPCRVQGEGTKLVVSTASGVQLQSLELTNAKLQFSKNLIGELEPNDLTFLLHATTIEGSNYNAVFIAQDRDDLLKWLKFLHNKISVMSAPPKWQSNPKFELIPCIGGVQLVNNADEQWMQRLPSNRRGSSVPKNQFGLQRSRSTVLPEEPSLGGSLRESLLGNLRRASSLSLRGKLTSTSLALSPGLLAALQLLERDVAHKNEHVTH